MIDDDDRPGREDYDDPDVPERDVDNACPECPTGVVVDAGPMERDTGHYPAACSNSCGWTN